MPSTPGSAGPTAATTPPPSELPARVRRFSRGERRIHRATAVLMTVCLVSAACLYLPQLAQLVGRRHLMVTVHEWSGILLPAPFLAGLASRAFRADLRRLNRFGAHDKEWWRAALRREKGPRPAGKFNAGQKSYAAWIAGATLVMLGTGLPMWFTGLAPLTWRTGATFVHDWLAVAVTIVLAGHIAKALADPESRRGLRTGWVDRTWAEREHPLWRIK
ncbi:cytochrome b/b6 domain-containing protein [Streptomyces indicus]|uniref:Formate dehydrogenase subunit gamma n=1 Tax=Streptomyces indicus TaxID=417292 RepID=A0A1G8XSY7_9ACTN|nr:cytochrome b/b6 domain-containing protein [Streptomyces indicus]SDJ93284.1 formate dehydrogenase subunit gamma [Streptomyces indicus]